MAAFLPVLGSIAASLGFDIGVLPSLGPGTPSGVFSPAYSVFDTEDYSKKPFIFYPIPGGAPILLGFPSNTTIHYGQLYIFDAAVKQLGLLAAISALAMKVFYDPQNFTGSQGGSTTQATQGNVTVVVNVTNAETIGEQVANTVADSVQRGIEDSAKVANDAAKQAADSISKSLGDVASTIEQQSQSFFGSIWDALKSTLSYIGDHLSSIFKAIADNIGTIVKDITKVVADVLDKIGGVLTTITAEIQKINDTLIQPIANIYNTTIKTITTLTTAIEQDLKDGLSGIMKIPTDIANGMASLDATMQRTIEQLGKLNTDAVNSTWKPMVADTIGTPLQDLNKTLGGQLGGGPVKTTFDTLVNLKDECSLGPTTEWIAKIQDEVANSDAWWAKGLKIILDGLLALNFVMASLEQKKECYAEDARKHLPITKMDTGTALAAWSRQYITASALNDELEVKGFDAGRIEVMKALQVFITDINQGIDWWFRGIIDESDLHDLMQKHMIDPGDEQAMKRGALNVFPPDVALEMYARGLIDANALQNVWKQSHMSDQEIAGRFDTHLRLPNVTETVKQASQVLALSNGLNIDTYRQQAPAELVPIAERDRIDVSVANIAWRLHWWVPTISQAMELFFRGVRTRTELYAIMDYWAVPPEFKDDLIRLSQSVIPYRTIPSMVKAGIITDQRAIESLQANGYTLEDAQALLEYSKQSGQTAKNTTATATHALSLSVAQSMYTDGTITEAQYREILAEHGYDAATVDLEVEYINLKIEADNRKQTAADIINECLVGLITYDDAQTQLASNNYTIAEQAKYLKQLRSTQASNSKIPSEAQAASMVKMGIISPDEYLALLSVMGYSEYWAARLLDYRTGIATESQPSPEATT